MAIFLKVLKGKDAINAHVAANKDRNTLLGDEWGYEVYNHRLFNKKYAEELLTGISAGITIMLFGLLWGFIWGAIVF